MSVIELYEKLSTAPDDKTRARIIAEVGAPWKWVHEMKPGDNRA